LTTALWFFCLKKQHEKDKRIIYMYTLWKADPTSLQNL